MTIEEMTAQETVKYKEMFKYITEHSEQLDEYDIKPLFNKLYFKEFKKETGIYIHVTDREFYSTFKYPIFRYGRSTSNPPVINTEVTPDQNIRELNAF